MQSYFCQNIPVTPKSSISSTSMPENFFHTHMQACLDYGSTLWDLACVSTLKSLVSLHRRVLKLILLKSTSVTDADNKTLCILLLKLRFEINKGIFVYKIMFEIASPYLKQLFQVSRLRGMNKIALAIPRIDLFKSSLNYSGAILWNSLPESWKKKTQKTYLPHP